MKGLNGGCWVSEAVPFEEANGINCKEVDTGSFVVMGIIKRLSVSFQ